MESAKELTIEERIKRLIRDFDSEHERFKQKDLATYLGITETALKNKLNTRKNEELPRSSFKPSEIVKISDFFDVSTDWILTGKSDENRTVSKDLGLSEEAINTLKQLKKEKGNYQESFIETAKSLSYSDDSLKIPQDRPVTEGGTTDEILSIINWLLSHVRGINFLSLIAKFCMINSSQAWIFDYDSEEESFPFTECNELYFKNSVGEGWTIVNPGILRYALIPAIESEIYKMRKEIVMKGVDKNGKKRSHEETGK